LLKLASAIIILAALSSLAGAQCPSGSFRTTVVTYYETMLPGNSTDSRCDYIHVNGKKYCHIRMRGVLHYPFYVTEAGRPPHQFPAIVYNHGSEHTFEATTKGCSIAEYFVPKGYIVFLPFRRGQGDPNNPDDKSTGTYIEDEVAACQPGDPCTHIDVFNKQTKEDVIGGFNWLKNRADVNDDAMAIMGISYGGRVTVLANDGSTYPNLGHKAAVAFSPAAESWGSASNPTPVQTVLITAAAHAKEPAFYLQAKWDYDTRPTIDLAYAHAYGGADDKHGKRFMASIYEYPKPDIDPSTGELDYQSVHAGFARDAALWGPAVLDFLKRNGVE
jgi:dienelactone hydrolase